MSFSTNIASYALYYGAKTPYDSTVIARIGLFDEEGRYTGNVKFFKDEQSLPDNSANEGAEPKIAYLTMHERQLDRVVDMLRNEKPCRVFYGGPAYAGIYTGQTEPVGEGEIEAS